MEAAVNQRYRLVLVVFFMCALNVVPAADKFKPFTFKTVDGSTKSLKDYLNKATLVAFFFPTCGYCNAEMPHLQKFYDQYKEQGFSMVAVNIVPDQNPMITDWQSSHHYTFAVLTGATIDSAQKDYGLKMTPSLYLLDSQGKVIFRQSGYKAGDETKLEDQIRKALNPAS
jgi:peroxiredoxin